MKAIIGVDFNNPRRVETYCFEITGNRDERCTIFLLGRRVHRDETCTTRMQSKVAAKTGVFGSRTRVGIGIANAGQPVHKKGQAGVGHDARLVDRLSP